jgi:hypothetical protein
VAGRRPSLLRLVLNERDARSVEFGLDSFSGHSATRETWATLGTHANEKRPRRWKTLEGVFAGQGPFQAPTERPSGHAESDVVVELEHSPRS